MTAVRLSSIRLYPLKSAGAIELDDAEVDGFGLRHDRRWMVVDEQGQFLTQRQHPRLALVRPALAAGALTLHAPDLPPLELPAEGGPGVRIPVQIWRDRCVAIDQGDAASRWLGRYLGVACRLVHMPEDGDRAVEANAAGAQGRVSFADAYPFLLVSEASLDGLNARLEEALPTSRFRPNLVVAGCPPHGEDTWARVRIGPVTLVLAKACDRCVVTTTDQETGERGREPLRTLATYRRIDNLVFFGQYAVHDAPGRLRVGATVEPEPAVAAVDDS
jgi:uncharacterized protein YcbX